MFDDTRTYILRINKTRRMRLEMRSSWRTFLCMASTDHEHYLSTSIRLDTRSRGNIQK
jgi:hypothetical protein